MTPACSYQCHLHHSVQPPSLVGTERLGPGQTGATMSQDLACRERRLGCASDNCTRTDRANPAYRNWTRPNRAWPRWRIRLGKNQHCVIAAEPKRIAHHVPE